MSVIIHGTNGITSSTVQIDGAYAPTTAAVSASDIDCSSQANYFTKTVDGGITFTVSNVPTGVAYTMVVEVTHTSGTINWFSGVTWVDGITPTLSTGKTHLFVFTTTNGGTAWRGVALPNFG